jgi:hypothetical protein
MVDLSVDVDGLGRAAAAMRAVKDGLDDTRSVIEGVGDSFGSSDVLDALLDFEDHWDDGRGRINDNIDDMQSVLEDSMGAYRKADNDLADALTEQETTTKNVRGAG